MTFPKRKPPIGFAVALAVVALGCILWLVMRSMAAGLDKELKEGRDRLAEMTAAANMLGELEKARRAMGNRVNVARAALLDVREDAPPESQPTLAQTRLNEIFSTLADKAGLAGVTIKYPSVGRQDKESPFQLVELNASMRCDEKELNQILLGLANHERLVPVTELRITSNWRNPKLPVLSVDITIGGYYRPNVQGAS